MSDLIEKVETVIEYQIQNHGFGPHVSRAAIAAVAEWLDENGDEWTVGARRILLKQLGLPTPPEVK